MLDTTMQERAALFDEIARDMRETAHRSGRTTLAPRVAAALARVPREAFVAPGTEACAYENRPLLLGHGQTISQPFMVALMTELLDLRPEDNVLEVGTGSGYQAAVLAELAGTVCSIEVIPELAARAAAVLAAQGYDRIALRTGDGSAGWPERVPFDAIIVTAAAQAVPPALLAQLRPGGRMMVPVGPPDGEQRLLLITKDAAGKVARRNLLRVAFVPLTDGRNGGQGARPSR